MGTSVDEMEALPRALIDNVQTRRLSSTPVQATIRIPSPEAGPWKNVAPILMSSTSSGAAWISNRT